MFLCSDSVCQISRGSTLLGVEERNGVQIPFGGYQGQCATCATRLLSGAVQMDTEAGRMAKQKMLDMHCLVRAELKERLSRRLSPALRWKIPTSYRTFSAQGDGWTRTCTRSEASFEKITLSRE